MCSYTLFLNFKDENLKKKKKKKMSNYDDDIKFTKMMNFRQANTFSKLI